MRYIVEQQNILMQKLKTQIIFTTKITWSTICADTAKDTYFLLTS